MVFRLNSKQKTAGRIENNGTKNVKIKGTIKIFK